MKQSILILSTLIINLCLLPGLHADINRPDPLMRLNFETGFLGILSHTIQSGSTNTVVNYIRDGGQENLYPVSQFSFEWFPARRHSLIFLYQPLLLETESVLKRDIRIDNVTFSSNTYMRFKYGFDFYRLSYLYHIIDSKNFSWDAGISFQIRVVSLVFNSQDGTQSVVNQSIGLVPILKTRARLQLGQPYYLEAELDGFYANVKVLNGSVDTEIIGSIIDANLRFGWQITKEAEAALIVRTLGGGSSGFSNQDTYDGLGDGFLANWLSSASLGLRLSYVF